MPWEAGELAPGSTVYVGGDPFIVVGTRDIIRRRTLYGKDWKRRVVSDSRCPPYVGVAAHPDGPQEGPRHPVLREDDEGSLHGTPIWWVSHLRVVVEGEAPVHDPNRKGRRRIWQRQGQGG